MVNPLGPHKKKHKMLAFYYLLGNLHQTSRAQKPVIQLLALCKSEDIKEFGFRSVANLINADLFILESQGVCVAGIPGQVYGALAYICGDNLNSHQIGGFNASFGPTVLRPCRFCQISRDEMPTATYADELKLRTKEGYNNNAALV